MAIDRRGPVLGSTAATTALVQFEIDQPLTSLARQIGARRGPSAPGGARGSRSGTCAARIAELGIALRPARRAARSISPATARRGRAARGGGRAARGGLRASYLTERELREGYGIDAGGRDRQPRQPRARPAQADRRAASRGAGARGARLYAPVEAVGFAHGGDGVEVATAGGPVISAGHVVLATGYELAPTGAGARGIGSSRPGRSPPGRSRARSGRTEALIWEASDPYLYLRATRGRPGDLRRRGRGVRRRGRAATR